MIRSNAEFQYTCERLEREEARLVQYEAELLRTGLTPESVERILESDRNFIAGLHESVSAYESLLDGVLPAPSPIHELGRALVGLRISMGVSQRELSLRLGVHESLISRDEKHEYKGLTLERAAKILEVLGVQVECSFQIETSSSRHGKDKK